MQSVRQIQISENNQVIMDGFFKSLIKNNIKIQESTPDLIGTILENGVFFQIEYERDISGVLVLDANGQKIQTSKIEIYRFSNV